MTESIQWVKVNLLRAYSSQRMRFPAHTCKKCSRQLKYTMCHKKTRESNRKEVPSSLTKGSAPARALMSDQFFIPALSQRRASRQVHLAHAAPQEPP